MQLAQRVRVEFGDDEATVAAKAATGDFGRLDYFCHAGFEHSAQFGVGRRAAYAAIDVQCNRPGFALDPKTRQQRIVCELVKIQQRQTISQNLCMRTEQVLASMMTG
jgi:hypothetical protein